ncbi:MAG: ammonium transporter [Dehalococcoidia bacterium]
MALHHTSLGGRVLLLLATLLIAFSALFILQTGSARAQEPPPPCGGKAEGVSDPCGDKTGTAADVTEDGSFDEDTVTNLLGHTKIAGNFAWIILCGALVLFFQSGFALVESGFTRHKNACHTMMMNFVIFAIGGIAWYLFGFALMFGGLGALASVGGGTVVLDKMAHIGGDNWGLFGYKGWALTGGTYDVGVLTFWFFQVVFMDTAGTIVTGGMAERWKWSAFCVYSFFMGAFIYPLFGAWTWGGGFLAKSGLSMDLGHGYVDFAGSGVVHAVGGWAALAGAMVIGPRIGKYNKDGTTNTIVGHSIPLAILGVFILVFGWVGFNAGSSLNGQDLRISVVTVNTIIASCTGLLAAMFYAMMSEDYGKKPDAGACCNGMLAGLVAVTAPCAFVAPWAAFLIGAIGGLFTVVVYKFVDTKLKIDDPVGAFSVHGVNGIWGLISVGIFADGTYGAGWNGVEGTVKGLLYGDASQLGAQVLGAVVVAAWAFGATYVFMKVQHAMFGIRVDPQVEIEGLDVHEMGSRGYEYGDYPTPAGADPMTGTWAEKSGAPVPVPVGAD